MPYALHKEHVFPAAPSIQCMSNSLGPQDVAESPSLFKDCAPLIACEEERVPILGPLLILLAALIVQRSAKRRGCLLSYSQAEPGRELT